MSQKIYEMITDRILEALDKGIIPWKKPWKGGGIPCNIRGTAYRGINLFLLGMSPYTSPYWLTYRQAKEMGGQVKKGEKSSIVIFWKMFEKSRHTELVKDDNGNVQEVEHVERIPFLRYYHVFNLQQCDGIEDPDKDKPVLEFEPITEAEKIIEGYPKPSPSIVLGAPSYCNSEDSIRMPEKESFVSVPAWYATIFHELTHSTGHKDRLNRASVQHPSFGSQSYSQEELVAEMGSAFLRAITGIESKEEDKQDVAYIQNWVKALKDDRKMVVLAGAQAQKAVDFITNKKYDEKKEEQEDN